MSKEKPNKDIVRSSAAEYLTFIAATGEGGVDVVYADENIWLSQKMMESNKTGHPKTQHQQNRTKI